MAPHMPDERLEELVTRLERAATELRAGELAPERAAALVDECARAASEASAELDRRVRAGEGGGAPAPGQLALGS
jgi:exonuclease VII small subunit